MASLSTHQLKYLPFYSRADNNLLLNVGFTNGTPKHPTTSKARAQSPTSKSRTGWPKLYKSANQTYNPAIRIKRNPKRRREEQHDSVIKKPIPGYAHSRGQKSLATVYGDLKLLCREGQLDEALTILKATDFRGDIPVDANIYDFLLQGCIDKKSLHLGRQVHNHMKLTGSHQNVNLATKLIQLYTICGSLTDAQRAFDAVPEKNSFLWNALLRAFVKNRFYEKE
ncbi:hypothetical protein KI387_008830, partial [Taxus chinensis]